MGFSVSFASMIIISSLFIFIVFSSLFILINTIEINNINKFYVDSFYRKIKTSINIEILNISDREVLFIVRNIGSETIFLFKENFSWCSVIFSYYDSNGIWRSLLIDEYDVLWIKPLNSSFFFDYDNHKYIYPGEEALIKVVIPDMYPAIPIGSIVRVLFATNYGSYSAKEGVRSS